MRVKQLEVKMSCHKARWRILALMLASHFPNIILSFVTAFTYLKRVNNSSNKVDFSLPFGYLSLLTYLTLWIEQFSLAVLALGRRFRLLNQNLKFTFNNEKIKEIAIINLHSTYNTEILAKIISELYSQLCEGIELVNDAFTLQLVPFVIYHMTANLFTMYSVIRGFFIPSSPCIDQFLNFGWLSTTTFILSIAFYAAENTLKCALQIPIQISSILKSEKYKSTEDIFKNLLLEVQCRNISFHNEFFTIDWKLLLSVIKNFIKCETFLIKSLNNFFSLSLFLT